jgi:hypothetical protein
VQLDGIANGLAVNIAASAGFGWTVMGHRTNARRPTTSPACATSNAAHSEFRLDYKPAFATVPEVIRAVAGAA